MPWLLNDEALAALNNPMGVEISAQQEVEYEARMRSENEGGSRLLTIAGDTARIEITGVLTNRPSFFARFFGGGNTTYPEIISAIAESEADPAVARREYFISSPGGSVAGLFEAIEASRNATKPSRTVASGVMASAAYMFGSTGDEIVATNKAVQLGSIGVMATLRKRGDEVIVTSTNAPNKAPDPETEKGKAVIERQLDGLADIFVDVIAQGRSTTVQKVNADFGRGATLLAEEAQSKGMIDAISGESAVNPKNVKSAQSAVKPMDIDKLKAEHPALYAQIFGLGSTDGAAKERERVSAHLTLGAASGDMKTALKAVEEGQELTALFQAKYQAASMKTQAIEGRVEDDDEIDADANADGDDKDKTDAGDQLFEAFSGQSETPILTEA